MRGNVAKGAVLCSDMTLNDCWIAKRGNFFAHGDTLHEAVEAVEAKWMENRPLDERIAEFDKTHPSLDEPYGDLFEWHHVLTGSCELGRLQWCEEHGYKPTDSITLRTFLTETVGDYGGDVIRRVAKEYGLEHEARLHELQKDFLIMARIIYKEGLEGQNRLECVEGVEIDLLNGQKALIYPKYSNEVLLDQEDGHRWHDAKTSETAALRLRNNQAATAALLEAGSQAARFVTKFTSERFGRFGLPTLLAAMEITEQEGEIDKLAREIDGADLLEDFSSNVWSCSRFNQCNGWIAYGNIGCAYSCILDNSFVAVPLVLLDTAADAWLRF